MEIFVEDAFDADIAFVIGQAEIEEGVFVFDGAVVAFEVAEQMRRVGALRIIARGLDVEV